MKLYRDKEYFTGARVPQGGTMMADLEATTVEEFDWIVSRVGAADVHNTFFPCKWFLEPWVRKKGEKRFFSKKCVFSLFLSQF